MIPQIFYAGCRRELRKVSPELIVPVFDIVTPCLPESWRRKLRCGIEKSRERVSNGTLEGKHSLQDYSRDSSLNNLGWKDSLEKSSPDTKKEIEMTEIIPLNTDKTELDE